MDLTPARQEELRSEIQRINAQDLAAARLAHLACCPFCRGQTTLISRPAGPLLKGSFAGCPACDIFTPVKPTDQEAVAAWNRWKTHGAAESLTPSQ